MGPKSAQSLLKFAERKNESIERILLRHSSMDVPRSSARAAGSHFPAYFVSDTVPVWNESARGPWALEVGGMVDRPLKLSLADLAALPRVGYRAGSFLRRRVDGRRDTHRRATCRVRRDSPAYSAARSTSIFQSFDSDYHESWDIDSATHPQTLVVYAQDGHYLNAAWGAPARIYSPVKLGYKNTKYLTRITFLPRRNGGYWSDRGYEWYGGV